MRGVGKGDEDDGIDGGRGSTEGEEQQVRAAKYVQRSLAGPAEYKSRGRGDCDRL